MNNASFFSVAVTVAGLACGPKSDGKVSLASSESWCPEGFEIGPADTCFAIPEKTEKNTPILVYLHGMYEGRGSAEEWLLVHRATAKGFAVIIPRGKRGACELKAELKDFFCWPSEADDPQAAKAVVADWDRVIWQVDALLEPGTHKRFVLGFSDGGAFASYLASRAMFAASGWAIVNGGELEAPFASSVPEARRAEPPSASKSSVHEGRRADRPSASSAHEGRRAQPMGKGAPILLVSASGDTDAAPRMKALNKKLTKYDWPHASCMRGGGHALSAEDVEAAAAFFQHDVELPSAKSPPACEGGMKPTP